MTASDEVLAPSWPPQAEEADPPSAFADVMGMAEPDSHATALAQIVDLDASLEVARVAYLRGAVELGELGVQLDAIADRLAGRQPRRGLTVWRTREMTARKLFAAASHDLEEGTDRWTRQLQADAMRPRRQRRQETPQSDTLDSGDIGYILPGSIRRQAMDGQTTQRRSRVNIEHARQTVAVGEAAVAAEHAEVDRQRRLRAAGQATRGDLLKAQRRHSAVLEDLLQARATVRRLNREAVQRGAK